MTIKPETLRNLINYDPDSGSLTWRHRSVDLFQSGRIAPGQERNRWNSRYAGRPALSYITRDGYCLGKIFGRQYLAHRVIWVMITGDWPSSDIDHINGVRSDNRALNLRLVSNQENSKNSAAPKSNTSGRIGVGWHKRSQKWHAYIGVSGRHVHLGNFTEKADAILARAEAEVKFGFHENHGRNNALLGEIDF